MKTDKRLAELEVELGLYWTSVNLIETTDTHCKMSDGHELAVMRSFYFIRDEDASGTEQQNRKKTLYRKKNSSPPPFSYPTGQPKPDKHFPKIMYI
jgi:hypothetical protein